MESEELYLHRLPSDLLRYYVLQKLQYPDIVELCKSNQLLNNRICLNPILIRELWKRDLSSINIPPNLTFEQYGEIITHISTLSPVDVLLYGAERRYEKLVEDIIRSEGKTFYKSDYNWAMAAAAAGGGQEAIVRL